MQTLRSDRPYEGMQASQQHRKPFSRRWTLWKATLASVDDVIAKILGKHCPQNTMTAITLNLSPDLEQKLRTEAAKEGIDPDCYIVNALQERLQPSSTVEKPTEADLLQQINIGFSTETWAQYHALIIKRHDETLSPQEHTELIQLSDRLESLNAKRIQALIQLASLRNQPLSDLMQTLGISPNPEVLDYA